MSNNNSTINNASSTNSRYATLVNSFSDQQQLRKYFNGLEPNSDFDVVLFSSSGGNNFLLSYNRNDPPLISRSGFNFCNTSSLEDGRIKIETLLELRTAFFICASNFMTQSSIFLYPIENNIGHVIKSWIASDFLITDYYKVDGHIIASDFVKSSDEFSFIQDYISKYNRLNDSHLGAEVIFTDDETNEITCFNGLNEGLSFDFNFAVEAENGWELVSKPTKVIEIIQSVSFK